MDKYDIDTEAKPIDEQWGKPVINKADTGEWCKSEDVKALEDKLQKAIEEKNKYKVKMTEILDNYTKWLLECNYVDCDVWCEEPKAIDRYLAEEIEGGK